MHGVHQLRRRPRRVGEGRRARSCRSTRATSATSRSGRRRSSPAELMPTLQRSCSRRLRACRRRATASPRRLAVTPDRMQSHGLDVSGALDAGRHRPGVGGRARRRRRSPRTAARPAAQPRHARVDRAGHQPRDHRQGQPAEHAGLRDAPRHRRAGRRRAGVDRPPRQQHRSGAARPAPTASRWRPTRRCAIPTNWYEVRLRRHRREGRRHRLRRQRLERRHPAVGLRHRRQPERARADAARHACSPIAASTARRGGAVQGDPAAEHADGMRLLPERHAGRHQRARRPEPARRRAHGARSTLEQRRVDVDAAGRGHARQLHGARDARDRPAQAEDAGTAHARRRRRAPTTTTTCRTRRRCTDRSWSPRTAGPTSASTSRSTGDARDRRRRR